MSVSDWIDKCFTGDCRDGMRQMIADGVRVQTCVCSPPYWGLRDYGVRGQLGLERTPVRYIARMRMVFRLVRELLADDGTLWLNMGDCYYTHRVNGGIGYNSRINGQGSQEATRAAQRARPRRKRIPGLKEKDLVGMPWLLALALRADGWYLRRDIIWSKPNPMPESVTDRPTTSHEYLFLLSKSRRYYYNDEAIKEPVTGNAHPRKPILGWAHGPGSHDVVEHKSGIGKKARIYSGNGVGFGHGYDKTPKPRQNASFCSAVTGLVDARSKRSVWTVPTQPFSGDHFATFPEKLIEPCILAGSRPGDLVFDPFMGSGTVAAVAASLGRRWLGCELNPKYAAMIIPRAAQMGIQL